MRPTAEGILGPGVMLLADLLVIRLGCAPIQHLAGAIRVPRKKKNLAGSFFVSIKCFR